MSITASFKSPSADSVFISVNDIDRGKSGEETGANIIKLPEKLDKSYSIRIVLLERNLKLFYFVSNIIIYVDI